MAGSAVVIPTRKHTRADIHADYAHGPLPDATHPRPRFGLRCSSSAQWEQQPPPPSATTAQSQRIVSAFSTVPRARWVAAAHAATLTPRRRLQGGRENWTLRRSLCVALRVLNGHCAGGLQHSLRTSDMWRRGERGQSWPSAFVHCALARSVLVHVHPAPLSCFSSPRSAVSACLPPMPACLPASHTCMDAAISVFL